jgi:hypothetical protein
MTHHDIEEEFLSLVDEHGPDYFLTLLIQYMSRQEDQEPAHQELIKDLKRLQHRLRTLSS